MGGWIDGWMEGGWTGRKAEDDDEWMDGDRGRMTDGWITRYFFLSLSLSLSGWGCVGRVFSSTASYTPSNTK